MSSFMSREDAARCFQSPTSEALWWTYPRVFTARRLEAKDIRTPRVYVYLRGGSACTHTDGETIFDVESAQVRLGFEDDSADRVLAFGMCNLSLSASAVSVPPEPGDQVWVQLGVDPVNRLTIFRGYIDSAGLRNDGTAYDLTLFDEVRRLLNYPFAEPSEASSLIKTRRYAMDSTETDLYASIQMQLAELLGEGSVLTHTLTGIEQYPILENDRDTLYEAVTALLREAQCKAYLSPTGRLLVTYTDTMPLWAPAYMSDLNMVPLREFVPWTNTNFHLPWNQARGMWFDRMVATTTIGGLMTYPNQYQVLKPHVITPFEFTEDNVIGVERIEPSEILNDVRTRSYPAIQTYTIAQTAGVTFEDEETTTFADWGDGAIVFDVSPDSVGHFSIRSRTYPLAGLAQKQRATNTPTSVGGVGPPVVGYGRYALSQEDWTESQVQARQFPIERIRITSPGILSIQPFEIVTVRLPTQGVEGYFQVEGRRIDCNAAGFRTVDTLRRMDLPGLYVELDVRTDLTKIRRTLDEA